ncbi:hypothetical protein BGZ63DRAFT_399617 [Mariannaea sp. PMI_226]|nr:hypothetical protein BGZ63DRAFT_399617 [Mariannaea sp. PMI_226]
MSGIPNKAAKFLKELDSARVLFVEWEKLLFWRMSGKKDGQYQVSSPICEYVPLDCIDNWQSLSFLTEISDFPLICEVAAEMRFRTRENPDYPGSLVCAVTRRFEIAFTTISSLGITLEELIRVPDDETILPCELYTVSIPTTCTGLLRRVASIPDIDTWNWMEAVMEIDDMLVVGFHLSYECLPSPRTAPPPPLSASEAVERDKALEGLEMWTFRSGEGWMKEMLTMLISRKQLWLPFIRPIQE